MANLTCLPSIDGCAMRVARLAADGTTPAGATNGYVTNKFMRVNFDPQYEEGETFRSRTACGELAVNARDREVLSGVNVELELAYPDAEMYELLTGGTLITTGGDSSGYAIPQLGAVANPNGISLEVWSRRRNADGSVPATGPYYRWVLPRLYFRIGARPIQRGPMTHAFVGYAEENPQWGSGPNNDWIPATLRALQWDIDSAIPANACGYWTVPVQA